MQITSKITEKILQKTPANEYGTKRFVGEVDRLSGVMDAQLSANQFLAGNEYTIVDIVTWPWAFLIGRLIDESMWTSFPNLKRWVDEVHGRPAVLKGEKSENSASANLLRRKKKLEENYCLIKQMKK